MSDVNQCDKGETYAIFSILGLICTAIILWLASDYLEQRELTKQVCIKELKSLECL